MNTLSLKSSVAPGALLLSAIAGFCAQPTAPAARMPAPLGLLRLEDKQGMGVGSLSPDKFSVDELLPVGRGALTKKSKDTTDYLVLETGSEWSRPLRGSTKGVRFVSFHLYASQSTVIHVGGAHLGVTASPSGGYIQIMVDDTSAGAAEWKELNLHVLFQKYEGRLLAALPILTVRLDAAAGIWDLFSGASLVAENLPLFANKSDARDFVVKAGSSGAWVLGLVMSDENPLFEDENENAIDDVFEKQKQFGRLLAKNAPAALRSQLAREWINTQRVSPPPALFIKRISADRPSR